MKGRSNLQMKARTMNISLPKRLVKALDCRAQAEARPRSEVIRAAVLFYLSWWEEWRKRRFTVEGGLSA